MSRIAILPIPLALCLLASALAQSARPVTPSCNFSRIQIGLYTSVYRINNKNVIVGTYNPNASAQFGYVLTGTTVTNIDYPGSAFTSAFGMNDNGEVVGAYAMTLTSPDQGFSWLNGVFTTLTYPGSLATYAQGINIHNVIVGTYQDSQGANHGFAYSGGKYVAINIPGATSTLLSGINKNGAIVGSYIDVSNVGHGILYQNGKFTVIDYPGAANTGLSAISDTGVIVGAYYNSNYSQWDGFVWDSGKFRSIVDPSAPTATAANGINDFGSLVGNAGYTAGFKALGCAP